MLEVINSLPLSNTYYTYYIMFLIDLSLLVYVLCILWIVLSLVYCCQNKLQVFCILCSYLVSVRNNSTVNEALPNQTITFFTEISELSSDKRHTVNFYGN